MQGGSGDCDPDTTSREPAQVLAARIRQQLDIVRDQCLMRLVLSRARLQAEAAKWDNAALTQALAAFQAAGRSVHLAPLRQNWFFRLFGAYQEVGAQFRAAYERMAVCESQVKTQLAQLSAEHMEHHLRAREALAEFEAGSEMLSASIDEGVTWLQDMCTQLADERGAGRNDDALTAQAETAQFFMQDFKQLQALSSSTQDAVVRAKSVLTRRSALLEQAKGELVTFEQAWIHRLGDVVLALDEGRNPSPFIPKAMEVHDELMKRLSASADACSALQHEEQLMAQQLATLQQDLAEGRAPTRE